MPELDAPSQHRKNEQHEIWEAVGDLRNDVGRLNTHFAGLTAEVRSINETMERIERNQEQARLSQTQNKPPYGIIISFCSLILAFITSIGVLAYLPLTQKDTSLHAEIEGVEERSKERQNEVRAERKVLIDLHTQIADAKRATAQAQIDSHHEKLLYLRDEFRGSQKDIHMELCHLSKELATAKATLEKVSSTQERFAGP